MTQAEPRNPLYFLLLVVSVIFVITVLAYAFIPYLEEKAAQAGADVPPSPWRAELREKGHLWLLYQVGAIVVLGFASMGLDRYRRHRREHDTRNIDPPR